MAIIGSAYAGFQVAMTDVKERFLQRSFDSIKKSLGLMAKKGKIFEEQASDAVNVRIKGTLDLRGVVGDSDLVIEAEPKNLKLKQEVFLHLDVFYQPYVVLALSTSTISITTIASATERPDKVIELQFAITVPMRKGVEVVRGFDT